MRACHLDSKGLGSNGTPRTVAEKPGRTRLAIGVMLALGMATSAHATDFVVGDAGDSGPGTLRQAVLDADASSGPHTITFNLPSGSAIGLTSGDIELTGPDVVVQGPGRDQLTISGTQHSRIFHVQTGILSISALTLRDGLALGDDSNESDQRGGAILIGAPVDPPAQAPPPPGTSLGLTLSDVAIFNSQAYSPTDGGGGAVFTQNGDLTIDHCLMDGNFARRTGGALTTRYGTVRITDSQFTNNTLDASPDKQNQAVGGGILINRSGGVMTRSIVRGNHLTGPVNGTGQGAGFAMFMQTEPFRIESSEFSDNQSIEMPVSIGGGVLCGQEADGTSPTFSLINSTISGNTGNYGVGLEAGCMMDLLNTTIADNTSTNYYGDGGRPGIEAVSPDGIGQTIVTITSSMVSGNLGGGGDMGFYHYDSTPDPVFIGSNALVQSPESNVAPPPDTITGVDPQLAPLAYNGGATRTHALEIGSVAIDAGSNPQDLASDQRGAPYARVVGTAADIGAFELDVDRIFANGFE